MDYRSIGSSLLLGVAIDACCDCGSSVFSFRAVFCRLLGRESFFLMEEDMDPLPRLFCFRSSTIYRSIFMEICLSWSDSSCLFLFTLPSSSLVSLFSAYEVCSWSLKDRLGRWSFWL